MSAFIVSNDLLDLLVTAGLRGVGVSSGLRVWHEGEAKTFTRHEGANEIGQILHDVNVHSVNYRYKESTAPSAYQYNGAEIPAYLGGPVIPWGHVLSALRCLDYQSCEDVETYPSSLGKATIEAITNKVCGFIVEESDAPWEWSRGNMAETLEKIKERVRS